MRNEILVNSFSSFRQGIESDVDESILEERGRALLTQMQRQMYGPLVKGFASNGQVVFEDIDFGEENLMISGSRNKPIIRLAVPVRHTVPRRQLDDVIRAVIDGVLPAGSITEIKVRSVKQSESEDDDDADEGDTQDNWMKSTVVMRLDNSVFMDVEDEEEENDDESASKVKADAAPKAEMETTSNPAPLTTSNAEATVKANVAAAGATSGNVLPSGAAEAIGEAPAETTDRGTNSEARTVREANPGLPDGKPKTTSGPIPAVKVPGNPATTGATPKTVKK